MPDKDTSGHFLKLVRIREPFTSQNPFRAFLWGACAVGVAPNLWLVVDAFAVAAQNSWLRGMAIPDEWLSPV